MSGAPTSASVVLDDGIRNQHRMGWEQFVGPPELRNIVVDPDDVENEISQPIPGEQGESNAENQFQRLLSASKNKESSRQKITSMFQASCPDSCDVEVSCRPSTARLSKSSFKPTRPATAMATVTNEYLETDLPDGVIYMAIFSIEKISYDVHMYDDKITWTPVSSADAKRPSSRSESGPLVAKGMVSIHEICSVRLKNIRNARANTVTTIGFAIFTAQQRVEKLREESTIFLCFSRDICIKWATRIKSIISARSERPKRLLTVAPQSITSRQFWDDTVESRLQTVGITGKLVEIHKSKSASDYVEQILADQTISQGSESYDGILVLSKTPFFSDILNTLLNFKAEVLKSGAWHPNIPTLGFLPASSVSFIGKELHGCSDVETAVFHAIYGCTKSVPICSFYDKDDNFIKHGLTACYGFSGGDTSAETTSKGFSTIQGSIRKGLAITKAVVQRRSYPCEIRYKDSPQNYEPYDDDEIFAEEQFSKFSIANEHFIDDDGSPTLNPKQGTSDADSGVWPQFNKWDTVPRMNYLDVTVTSLPQYGIADEIDSGCPLSTILVRETMSRKDLLMGMGSQVSLSSTMSKSKPEILDKTDIIRGSEFVIKPCGGDLKTGASGANYLSRWTIDDVRLDADIQELHVKVCEYPLLMYSRAPGEALSVPAQQKTVRLDSSNIQSFESTA